MSHAFDTSSNATAIWLKIKQSWKGNSFSFNLYIVESFFFPLLAAVMFTALSRDTI